MDPEGPPLEFESLSFIRDLAELIEEPSGQGHVLPFGQRQADRLRQIVKGDLTIDQPPVGIDPDDFGLVAGCQFVGEVTDEGLQEILQRQDACHAAVLVHDEGHAALLGAHFREGFEDVHRFWEHQGLPDSPRDVDGAELTSFVEHAPASSTKEVLDKEEADNVIEIIEDHWIATVTGLSNGAGNIASIHRGGQGLDVDSRSHDLADRDVRESDEVLGDLSVLPGFDVGFRLDGPTAARSPTPSFLWWGVLVGHGPFSAALFADEHRGGLEGEIFVAVSDEQRTHCPTDLDGIEGLDQPSVSTRSLRLKHVRATVQQHEKGN